jgi:hypothetical protein
VEAVPSRDAEAEAALQAAPSVAAVQVAPSVAAPLGEEASEAAQRASR